MSGVLLEIENLSKRYCRDPKRAAAYAMRDIWNDIRRLQNRDFLRTGEFWALRDVEIQVSAGEVVGLIGHNGAGKSTLINLAAGVLRPTVGKVSLYTDRVVLMDHHGGLSPVQTGRENIGNQLSLYGMHEAEIAEVIGAVAAYSDLGDFVDAPVGTYSLGMKLRLAFAIYSRLKPDIFIVDEALGGGDVRFRSKFMRFLREYIDQGGAILVASHDLFSVQSLCHRCILMEQGRVHTVGTPQEVIYSYNLLAQEKDRADAEENLLQEDQAQFVDAMLGIAAETDTIDTSKNLLQNGLDSVAIHSVEVTGVDGGAPCPGEPLSIRVVCDSSEPFESVLCSVEVGTADVFPVASFAGGHEIPYKLQRGRTVFDCAISNCPLAPGVYYVAAYVVLHDSGAVLATKGHQDERILFTIRQLPGPDMNMAVFRKNIVYISGVWTQHEIDAVDANSLNSAQKNEYHVVAG